MAKLVNRREMMFSVGGVMVAGAIAGCAAPVPAEAPPASGTIALPPARNTGTLESKTVPRTAWTRTVDNPVRNLAYADGRVFVSTLSETMALDASTGRELWRAPLLTQGGGRAIANGTWYAFGGYTPDPFTLLAVDCASGRVQWTYTPPRGVSLSGPISTPLNGALYVTVNNDAVQNMQVWAIDVVTRQVRWMSLCTQGNTDVYAPAAGTQVLNWATLGGNVAAYDTASGRQLWQTSGGTYSLGSQPPAGKTVIIYSTTAVMGLDSATGARLWQATPSPPGSLAYPARGWIIDAFASNDDTYYVRDGASLRAFRAGSDATQIWSTRINMGKSIMLGMGAEFGSDDTMFVATGNGRLYAVDTRTGGCHWEYPGGSSPRLGMVYDYMVAGVSYCFITHGAYAGEGPATVTALAPA